MPYRRTIRYIDQLRRMRAAKEQKRMIAGADAFRFDPPSLRRVIIVYDYDFGCRVHRIDLYRTNRIDCYRAEADGRPWKPRIGWTSVLDGLRKGMPRVKALT